jgi:hypothetical protein
VAAEESTVGAVGAAIVSVADRLATVSAEDAERLALAPRDSR